MPTTVSSLDNTSEDETGMDLDEHPDPIEIQIERRIHQAMQKMGSVGGEMKIDRIDSRTEKWVPLSIIQEVTPQVVEIIEKRRRTQASIEKTQEFVHRAMRLCALLVYVGRMDWFEIFREQEFDDEMFPMVLEMQINEVSGERSYILRALRPGAIETAETPKRSVTITPDGRRDKACIKLLESEQWRFFVPVFRPNTPVYSFHDLCILPFIREVEHGATKTKLSNVRRFVIHQSHLDFALDDQVGTVVDENQNPHVAVIEINTANTLSMADFDRIIDNEGGVLNHFRNQGHDHLIKFIARYSHRDRHFFIFPWAKGGNLRNFWNTQPSLIDANLDSNPEHWPRYIEWFFQQLIGIGGAVKHLHHPQDNPGVSHRHGDLKPENILCFCKNLPGPGKTPTEVRLVITDPVHAKIHERETELQGKNTSVGPGTLSYSPPEVYTGDNEPLSELYDIWSLGCLYLEFLIWLLYGKNGLERFNDDARRGGSYAFYRLEPTVSLKPEVLGWIEKIKEDKRCAPISSTAVGRLVDLIETRLLVVDISGHFFKGLMPPYNDSLDVRRTDQPEFVDLVRKPNEGPSAASFSTRADAEEMLHEMKRIVQSAEGKHQHSLRWINWDAVAYESGFNKPKARFHRQYQEKELQSSTLLST
ncbi:Serine/threonine-protein kinase nekl-2 [Colletotrichum siamense]|nr:Serine/threonine-protein kinase nekl-2 [Colletotrichum siamense]